MGSFSGMSVNEFNESSQSVAQEMKTNESKNIQTYAINNLKQYAPPITSICDLNINNSKVDERPQFGSLLT